jgi:hypothetical protein
LNCSAELCVFKKHISSGFHSLKSRLAKNCARFVCLCSQRIPIFQTMFAGWRFPRQ